jgi:Carbohydrate binding domain
MKRIVLSALLFAFPTIALADGTPEKMTDASAAKAAAKESKSPNLFRPTNDPESWHLEMTEGGKGEMKADGEAIVFTTTATDGTDWHVQAYQTGLDLKKGKAYVVKFKSKAPQANDLFIVGQINEEDWHEIGLHEKVGSSDDFKQFEFEFTAADTVPNNSRIGFVLGTDKGVVSVKDLTLTEK